jgi:UDP-N-acetylglucosamine:LPS N-acetylglucosamine transferase
LLYARTGGGHLRVAQTLADELRLLAPDCEIALHDGLTGARVGRSIDSARAYATLTTQLIWLFNQGYRLADTPRGVEMLRRLIRWLWGDALAVVVDCARPDLVVSTHLFMSPSTLGPTKHQPRWATIVTDLGTPPLIWFDPRTDLIVVSTPEIAAYARTQGKVASDRVVGLDYEYCVHGGFQQTDEPPAGADSILVLGGGVGAGAIPKQVATLRRAFPRTKIVVVCGRNARLRRELARQVDKNLEVHGFVDNLDELMRRAALVVTKAGPGTIAEAAIMRKPLVITSWIGLQERDNVKLVVSRGLGLFCPNVRDLPAAIDRIQREYESFRGGDRVFRPGAAKVARILLGAPQT